MLFNKRPIKYRSVEGPIAQFSATQLTVRLVRCTGAVVEMAEKTKRREPTKLRTYFPLMTGIVASQCADPMLSLIRNALYGMTAVAAKTAATCTVTFPPLVMNPPFVFFIAGGNSSTVLLAWRRDH